MYAVPELSALLEELVILLFIMLMKHVHRVDQVLVHGLHFGIQTLYQTVHGKLNSMHRLSQGVYHLGLPGVTRGCIVADMSFQEVFFELRVCLLKGTRKGLQSFPVLIVEISQIFDEVKADKGVIV